MYILLKENGEQYRNRTSRKETIYPNSSTSRRTHINPTPMRTTSNQSNSEHESRKEARGDSSKKQGSRNLLQPESDQKTTIFTNKRYYVDRDQPKKKYQKICWWETRDKCKYGAACYYVHLDDILQPYEEAISQAFQRDAQQDQISQSYAEVTSQPFQRGAQQD